VDPIRLALLAMGSAIAFGLALVSATVIGVDLLRAGAPPQPASGGAPLYLLFFGTLAGLCAAGAVAWRLLSPILSTYRRGGLSLASAFATVVVMLLCIPVHQIAGRAGLIGLGITALLVASLLGRRARRTALVASGVA
jgi:hypothetical protein